MNVKVDAPAAAAMPVAAIIVGWIWNGFVGDPAMPPEVQIAVGVVVGAVVRWAVAFVPKAGTHADLP